MRPTYAEINLAAIRHNILQIRSRLLPDTEITAVVKANAYGHGAVPVSKAALAAGANYLAVAIPEEGLELRAAGITAPILVLGLTMPEQAELLVKNKLTASVCTHDQLNALRHAAHKLNTQARAVVKVDTGMHRIGLKPSQLLPFVRDMLTYPGIELRGVFTHLATADADNKTFANAQLAAFNAAVSKVTSVGIALPFISAANSATIIDLPHGHFNTVRAGIIMYGLPPSSTMQQHLNLQPALQFKTKIVYIKQIEPGDAVSYGATYRASAPTFIATLPVGYADGYFRQLSNHSNVLIGGKRRPVVGRVCMDQLMVDLGPVCDANIGDEAVLLGKQGTAIITADEIADLANTINYEVVCAISARVPRVYIN